MVERSDTGIAVEPENPEALKNGVLSLMVDKDRCLQFGENGRRFVEKHFSRSHIAEKLADILDVGADD